MIFISIEELYSTIATNSWKVSKHKPKGIIGVPRSGMLPATILSQELHLGLCSINEFFDNNGDDKVFNRHGTRPIDHPKDGPYIVVEDSNYNGQNLGITMNSLKQHFPNKKFISCAAFLEGPTQFYKADITLRDIREEAQASVGRVALYQWSFLDCWWNWKFLWDLDGVMCIDPPADSNTEAYEAYLDNPIPLHIPKTPSNYPISICTYRLKKYAPQTNKFLKDNGINCNTLWMYNADTKEERNLKPAPVYKAEMYKSHPEYMLYIESNDYEAQAIWKLSEKPVYCFSTGKLYK